MREGDDATLTRLLPVHPARNRAIHSPPFTCCHSLALLHVTEATGSDRRQSWVVLSESIRVPCDSALRSWRSPAVPLAYFALAPWPNAVGQCSPFSVSVAAAMSGDRLAQL